MLIPLRRILSEGLLALLIVASPALAQSPAVQPVLICEPDMSCVTLNAWMKSTPPAQDMASPDASGLFGVRPTVRVKLTDGQKTWYEELPAPRHTANRAYWLSTGLSLALTVADVENSHYALNRLGTSEANPLFGSHPGRVRYYGICLPIFAINAYMSYRYKREDDAMAMAGIRGHKYVKWWLPNALNGGMHAIGLAVTLGATGR